MKPGTLHYGGLYGEATLPHASGYVHLERLEDRSNLFNWEIKEHFHSELVQLFHITGGHGKLIGMEEELRFTAPCLLFIPVSFLHGFVFESAPEGTVLTLSDQLFENSLKESTTLVRLSQSILLRNFDTKDTAYLEIIPILNRISACCTDSPGERNLRLSALLKILFFDLAESGSFTAGESSNQGYLDYFQRFQRRLRQTIHGTWSISAYAAELGISSVHLNRICQHLVGKSAGKIMQEMLIKEAKNYLLHTDFSISEVAYLLNFHDPAHFSRFFKQHTGVAPKEFRA